LQCNGFFSWAASPNRITIDTDSEFSERLRDFGEPRLWNVQRLRGASLIQQMFFVNPPSLVVGLLLATKDQARLPAKI
jgi:hypothetical protein